ALLQANKFAPTGYAPARRVNVAFYPSNTARWSATRWIATRWIGEARSTLHFAAASHRHGGRLSAALAIRCRLTLPHATAALLNPQPRPPPPATNPAPRAGWRGGQPVRSWRRAGR